MPRYPNGSATCLPGADAAVQRIDARPELRPVAAMHPRVEQHPRHELKVRRELEQPRERRHHVFLPAQVLQRDAAVVQRLRVAGIDRQRTVEARHGGLEPSQVEQRDAAVVQRRRTAGLERQRAIEARHGVVEPFQVEQRVAAVVVRFRIVRPERQRTVVARERLVDLPELLQRQAEVDACRREIGFQGNRGANRRHRGIVATGLVLHEPEHVERIEMPRRAREDFPIEPLGVVEPATSVQRERLLQLGVDVASHGGGGGDRAV